MNTAILKPILKSFLPMMPEVLGNLEKIIAERLSGVALDAAKGEEKAVYMILAGRDGKNYLAECVLDKEDKIVRIINQSLIAEFIQQLITENFK